MIFIPYRPMPPLSLVSRTSLKPSPNMLTAKTRIARAGLVLPYEMAKALKLPQIIDQELPPAGSGHGYKPSQFVMPLILMFHGGGKTLEDLREIKGEISLCKLMDMEGMPASCTVGDWLRRMGGDSLPVWWQTATIATARWKLYQTAAKVVYHSRILILKLSASIEKISLFQQVCDKCIQMGYG